MISLTTRKIATACHYATSASCYPWLWRRSLGRLFGSPGCLEHSAGQARRWCRRRCLSNAEAVEQLTGNRSPGPLEQRHADIFAAAFQAVANCPQKMGGGANLTLLHDLTALSGARFVVETGVAYGWSSLAILLALREHPNSRLISTNLHYREYEDDHHVGCAVPRDLREGWTIIRKPDDLGLPEALAEFPRGIDLCHYDSDKSYQGRLRTYPLLWNALKPGGLLVSDDVQDNLAFAHFARMAATTPVITDAASAAKPRELKFVGILRKTHEKPLQSITF